MQYSLHDMFVNGYYDEILMTMWIPFAVVAIYESWMRRRQAKDYEAKIAELMRRPVGRIVNSRIGDDGALYVDGEIWDEGVKSALRVDMTAFSIGPFNTGPDYGVMYVPPNEDDAELGVAVTRSDVFVDGHWRNIMED